MSLWSESLYLHLNNCGDDPEKTTKCILAHLSMTVPRSWWEHALQTRSVPESYVRILQELREELLEVPAFAERVGFALLVALAFADDNIKKREPKFGAVHSQSSIEEYLSRAKKILTKRQDLSELGKMIEKKAKSLV